ncbi:ATP-grasp domain-containing protein [bacterium]|nr:ATP-grasp domain-containing protein [bacterium]
MADVIERRAIHRLLVANRGEIARRVFRTAREMGIATVAVHSEGDADAPFVRDADQAVALGGRTSAESYLDIGKIIDACRRSGADAVHPGYGFLSENAGFAQAVLDAGLIWVGPSPAVIAKMGDKLSAKAVMAEAGVPTLPAIELKKRTDVRQAARKIGYPVLVKASAGGGGRGMRVVAEEADLEAAIDSARREARGAFGDDTVFLEKWLDRARHVEVQILGDQHGSLVHCFERECSIQRRHQKIIEEAPSPAVDAALRNAMCEAALSAARVLGYASAGTVEFLVSGGEFWFLEVNARLQVEHPVTEAIIGRDLVREQIRIAEGEPLSFRQSDLAINGWAIEARLCAEDPSAGFLPSPGALVAWRPSPVGGARFDSGVEPGAVVSPDFDAMIAKVIVHAATRREAASRLARSLETTEIQGLVTNRDFLVACLRHEAFLSGDTTTDFIARCAPATRRRPDPGEIKRAVIAATLEGQVRRRAAARVLRSLPSGWRHTTTPDEQIQFMLDGITVAVSYRMDRSNVFRIEVDGETHAARIRARDGEGLEVDIDGVRERFRIRARDASWFVHSRLGDLELVERPRFPPPQSEAETGRLTAPMPGVVFAISVASGDQVTKGQVLMVLEAMKMEHRIVAPHDGRITELKVAVGDQVTNGQLLLQIET